MNEVTEVKVHDHSCRGCYQKFDCGCTQPEEPVMCGECKGCVQIHKEREGEKSG